jgi:Tfp pilus assembly major pilin PilA
MNELGLLAIKGKRYSEAESIFNQEIQSSPNPSTYLGLGVCKINLILDLSRTLDEVFYCFNKSVLLADDDAKENLENDILAICFSVISQLKDLDNSLEKEKAAQNKKVAFGAALAVGSAMIGSSHKANAFTQISSLAAAGAGVGIALDGLAKLGTIPEIQNKINAIILEISINLKSYKNYLTYFKSVEESQKINYLNYSIEKQDLNRMSYLANNINLNPFGKDFKENLAKNTELKSLMDKYNVKGLDIGKIKIALQKNPIE